MAVTGATTSNITQDIHAVSCSPNMVEIDTRTRQCYLRGPRIHSRAAISSQDSSHNLKHAAASQHRSPVLSLPSSRSRLPRQPTRFPHRASVSSQTNDAPYKQSTSQRRCAHPGHKQHPGWPGTIHTGTVLSDGSPPGHFPASAARPPAAVGAPPSRRPTNRAGAHTPARRRRRPAHTHESARPHTRTPKIALERGGDAPGRPHLL